MQSARADQIAIAAGGLSVLLIGGAVVAVRTDCLAGLTGTPLGAVLAVVLFLLTLALAALWRTA
jgi:hypothetical protein